MRPLTFAIAENGGFISTTVGVIASDRGDRRSAPRRTRVTVRPGKRWASRLARVSANSFRTSEPPAISARTARSPVPADGSSTQSRRRDRGGASSAARPSGIGVENCWKRLALLGTARMGGKKACDLHEQRKRRGRRAGFAKERLSVFAQEQNRRGFAGVVGRFPVPSARGVGGAEGSLHGGARGRRHRPACRVRDEGEGAWPPRRRCAATPKVETGEDGAACRAADEDRSFIDGDLGERERDEPIGALSRTAPAQTRPGRPLTLRRRT